MSPYLMPSHETTRNSTGVVSTTHSGYKSVDWSKVGQQPVTHSTRHGSGCIRTENACTNHLMATSGSRINARIVTTAPASGRTSPAASHQHGLDFKVQVCGSVVAIVDESECQSTEEE